jgi:hypothetical protein
LADNAVDFSDPYIYQEFPPMSALPSDYFRVEIVYCFAKSRSIVSFTSSPTTAAGNFVAIPNAVRLIVVVAEKPE